MFKKGQKVKYKGKIRVVEVPNAKADFVGIVPLGKEGNKDAVDLVREDQLELTEAMATDKFTDISQLPQYDDTPRVDNDDFGRSITVTNEVFEDLQSKIKELIEKGNESYTTSQWSYDFFMETAQYLGEIMRLLSFKTEYHWKKANIYFNSALSPMQYYVPSSVLEVLTRDPLDKSLKGYVNSVKWKRVKMQEAKDKKDTK